MDNALTTIKQTTALTTNEIARELAGRLKFMIQNGRALQDNEVFALAQDCAANDLNPFSGEAYYIPSAGPCPGIAGWRKKAQEQLNWEASAQGENGAHFWVETREASTEEAGHDPNAGDIAMFVTLHDWLTNKRWRRAFFDTLRELKDVGYPLEDATSQAKVMVGPEPVWTGVGVVYAKENFGGDKFNRAERASKRAEKIALRKRFPRVNLPEPTGADAGSDVYDTSFTIEPPARKSEAELMAEITGEPAPKPQAPAAPAVAEVPAQAVTQSKSGEDYAAMDIPDLARRHAHYSKVSRDTTISEEERAEAGATVKYLDSLIKAKRQQ